MGLSGHATASHGHPGVVFTAKPICEQFVNGAWKKIFTKSIFKILSPKFDFFTKFVYNKFRNKTKQPDDIPQRTGAYYMARLIIGI